MASDKQRELFAKLLSEKEFPEGTPSPLDLMKAFNEVDTASGSEWIEKALALPDKGHAPPPF